MVKKPMSEKNNPYFIHNASAAMRVVMTHLYNRYISVSFYCHSDAHTSFSNSFYDKIQSENKFSINFDINCDDIETKENGKKYMFLVDLGEHGKLSAYMTEPAVIYFSKYVANGYQLIELFENIKARPNGRFGYGSMFNCPLYIVPI